MSLKHAFSSSIADGGDTTLVRPSDWNAEHSVSAWDEAQAVFTQGVGSWAGMTYEQYRDSPFLIFFFKHDASNQRAYYTFTMPRDWDETAPVRFQGHFVPMANPTASAVALFSGAYAWINSQNGTVPAGTAWTHFTSTVAVSTSGAFSTINQTLLETTAPSGTAGASRLCVVVGREGTSAVDTYSVDKSGGTVAANLGALYFDLLYKKNKIGSDSQTLPVQPNATTFLTSQLASGSVSITASGETVVNTRLLPNTNAVSHIYFTGSAITSTLGETWATSGTITWEAPTTPWPEGAKKLTSANYFTSGSGNDNGDFASGVDYTVAAVFKWDAGGAGVQFLCDGVGGANGWIVRESSGKLGIFRGNNEMTNVGPALTSGSRYVLMFGMSGTTQVAQVNQGTIATQSAGTQGAGTTAPFRIGTTYDNNAIGRFSGTFYEVAVYNTTPTSASFAAIYTQVASIVGTGSLG